MRFHRLFGTAVLLCYCISAQANDESSNHFALPISASFGLGSLGNTGMGVPMRTVDAYSFEALPSYKVGSWLVGPHLDYRFQDQLTGLAGAGGLNWRGQGYLIGIGERINFESLWFLQGSVDFIGRYNFHKQTSSQLDDHLFEPFGVRIKVGKVIFKSLPHLSLDADLQYLTYRKIQVGPAEQSSTSRQVMVAVGLTCVIPCWSREVEVTAPIPAQPPAEKNEVTFSSRTDAQVELSKVLESKREGSALKLTLTGTNFDVGSAELTAEGSAKIAKVAQSLVRIQGEIRVEGHTDSSGDLHKNLALSEARAESVKRILIQNGVASKRVSTRGFGPQMPVASNSTTKGKTQNRRVDIYVDQETGK